MNSANHALIGLLRRDVLGDAVPVSLDAPNRPWTQAAVRPTVNLFLYDVRENLSRREVMLEPVRDSSGVVVGRRPPPTRYDLFYLLSVWGCPVALEHQLLAAIISGLGSYDVLPAELFERPDERAPSSFLSTASGMKRGMLPMFSGELKMQVELIVTTSVPVSATTFEAGPPVREPARITVLDQSPEDIAARGKMAARMPRPRVAEADPHAATRAAVAAAVEALPPPPPAPAGGPPGAARPAGAAGPGGARPPGAPAGGARPPGAPAGGARPAGPPPGAPPGSAAPGAARPAGAPPGAAGPPKAAPPPPLVALRAALAQAAQAQAVLAQAVASLATMLPAGGPAQAPARPAAGLPPAAAPPPAAAAGPPPAAAAGPPPAAAAGPPPAAAAGPASEAPARPSAPPKVGPASETTP